MREAKDYRLGRNGVVREGKKEKTRRRKKGGKGK